jgi:hypothetical protein
MKEKNINILITFIIKTKDFNSRKNLKFKSSIKII